MLRSLRWTLLTVAAATLPPACTTTPASPGALPAACDVWIRGGDLVDGSGAPAARGDVLVVADRIAFVGDVPDDYDGAARTIDATGKVVTPGFVDVHAHGDPRRTPGFANFLRMGVTTICLGLDGQSPGGGELRAWMQAVERGRHAPNVAAFVGHGTVRALAGVGLSPAPTAKQLDAMAALVDDAMQAGAFGLSTGLEYEPGRFATAAELAAVARPVARHGGLVASHLRSEDDDAVEAAIGELLQQCEAAGCRAHVSHLKIVYGRDPARADDVLAMLAAARARGVPVTADAYPYAASYTGVGIVFPAWAKPPHDHGAVARERRAELEAFLRERVAQRNGPGAMLLGGGPWRGRTLADVARELGKPFEHVLIDDIGPDGPGAAHFVMDERVVQALLVAEHVMVASDGSPTMLHPRGHGTFARVLREFVHDTQVLDLPTAVHKMSGLPATTIGLDRAELPRGLVRTGFAADLCVFDPSRVADRATFEAPFEPAEGIYVVLVNGQLVVDGGVATPARPGRLLRHRPRRDG